MAESNFTTPEQKNAADRSSGSASEKLEPSLNTLQGETAQTQAEPTIPVREEASAAPKGFGAVLRAAREAEGISVGDMAVQCRLAVTQIRALEEERLENLPEPVYVRAFIRGYAHALKIDPAPLVDDYMMRCGRRGAAVEVGQLPNRSPSREAVFHEPPKNRTLKAVLFVVLAALVGGGIWAVYTDQFASLHTSSEAQKVESGANEAKETKTPAAEPAENAAQPSDAAPETQPAQPAAPAAAATPGPPPSQASGPRRSASSACYCGSGSPVGRAGSCRADRVSRAGATGTRCFRSAARCRTGAPQGGIPSGSWGQLGSGYRTQWPQCGSERNASAVCTGL